MATMTAPPRRRDLPVVLYAHPFELLVGVALIVIGLRAALEGTTTPSVDSLPDLPLLLYRAATTVGGIGIVAGLLNRDRLRDGKAIERASLYVVSGAWFSYSVLVIGVQGWRDGFASAAITGLIATACLLRASAIAKTERVILATLREANADPDVLRRIVDGRPPREGDA
jgi:hypothetical protein